MHKIDWLNQPGFKGETINPIRVDYLDPGCDDGKVELKDGTHCEKVGPGCANCYAERHNMRCLPGGGTGLPYTRPSREKVEVYLDEAKLDKVRRWRKPRCVFWCSLTDMFGEWVPDEMIHACLTVMADTPRHRHIVLTKRPERGTRWDLLSGWLLASASNQGKTNRAAWALKGCAADVLGLSLEPLLEHVEIPQEAFDWLDWVILGCESGPRRRPCKLEWVRSIVQQCRDTGVACFVKQVPIPYVVMKPRMTGGITSTYQVRVSRDPAEWPEDLRVQQFPEVK